MRYTIEDTEERTDTWFLIQVLTERMDNLHYYSPTRIRLKSIREKLEKNEDLTK
jgi:hypothetical protein